MTTPKIAIPKLEELDYLEIIDVPIEELLKHYAKEDLAWCLKSRCEELHQAEIRHWNEMQALLEVKS